jgi:asparagine synthase (glutamine-hydrolysing)
MYGGHPLMCGIAGLIDYGGHVSLHETIEQMSAAIAHRGPDGRGALVLENVALGHRRLSIIDHEGGRQPMSTPDGQVHLTYNGEVYNYRELRLALKKKGYQFRTESDTEVILYAYEAWGKRCVEHFEGMYAFAIADFRKRELFLARDPFGIKPLLYRVDEKSFAFASEFQALQQLPDWSGDIDLYAIDLYLRYQYIPAPHTAFRKVFKLPAGHRMTVRMGESFQKVERYWEPDFSKKRKWNATDLVDALDNALRDSVKRHLVSDVPFGALLSGGVDSSLVVGYMSELLNRPVKTFSIGFEDESVNELQYARIVAKKYGTEHHEEIVRFDALEMLPEIVKHYGEPFGDQSAIPTWAVSRLARSEVPMVLSGDGGDELFAGYNWYGSWLNQVSNVATSPKRPWKSRLKRAAKVFLFSERSEPIGQESQVINWLDQITRFHPSHRERLWNPDLRFLSDSESQTLNRSFAEAADAAGVNRVQRVDLETYLPENILRKVDIASMRYGLEVRPPILDLNFFKVASLIPAAMLYKSGANGNTYCGKMPLKQLAAKKFGEDFAFRPKQGFVLPLHSWLRNNPQNLHIVQEKLLHSHSHIRNWFDMAEVRKIVVSGNPENLWLLLTLEEWSRQFITGNSAGELIHV